MDKYTESELYFPEAEKKPRYYIPPRDKEEPEDETPRMSAREYYRRNRDADINRTGSVSSSYKSGNYRTRGAKKNGDRKISFKERLMTQSVAAGALLLLILAMNFLDIGFVNTIKSKIRSSVSRNVTLEEVYAVGSEFTDTVKTIFGFENEKQYENDINQIKEEMEGLIPDTAPASINPADPVDPVGSGADTLPQNTAAPGVKATQAVPEESTDSFGGSFRIDEDILNEINSREDPYTKNH